MPEDWDDPANWICGKCRFFDAQSRVQFKDHPNVVQTCKRFPKWEDHKPDDTCGEWRPKT